MGNNPHTPFQPGDVVADVFSERFTVVSSGPLSTIVVNADGEHQRYRTSELSLTETAAEAEIERIQAEEDARAEAEPIPPRPLTPLELLAQAAGVSLDDGPEAWIGKTIALSVRGGKVVFNAAHFEPAGPPPIADDSELMTAVFDCATFYGRAKADVAHEVAALQDLTRAFAKAMGPSHLYSVLAPFLTDGDTPGSEFGGALWEQDAHRIAAYLAAKYDGARGTFEPRRVREPIRCKRCNEVAVTTYAQMPYCADCYIVVDRDAQERHR
jgi:hypothetical protein